MFVLQIVAIILCVAFFAYVVHLVARERLLLKYSLLWMALTVVIVLCACFLSPVLHLVLPRVRNPFELHLLHRIVLLAGHIPFA